METDAVHTPCPGRPAGAVRWLPGGVEPAAGSPGAHTLPVEQKTRRDGPADHRQDPDVSFGGEDSGEAARHFFFLSLEIFKKRKKQADVVVMMRSLWWNDN